MTREEIQEELAGILEELFEIPREKVVPHATLYEDLDLDSIDAIDIVLKIQAMTGRSIQPQDFKHVRTIDDVLVCVEKLLASNESAA